MANCIPCKCFATKQNEPCCGWLPQLLLTAAWMCLSVSWVLLGWLMWHKITLQAKWMNNLPVYAVPPWSFTGHHAGWDKLTSCRNQNYLLEGFPQKLDNNLKKNPKTTLFSELCLWRNFILHTFNIFQN